MYYPSNSYARNKLMNNPLVSSKFQPNQTISYEDLKSKVLFVEIFYSKMSYTKIEKLEKADMNTLISNNGGKKIFK